MPTRQNDTSPPIPPAHPSTLEQFTTDTAPSRPQFVAIGKGGGGAFPTQLTERLSPLQMTPCPQQQPITDEDRRQARKRASI